jgi:hypothetical protein
VKARLDARSIGGELERRRLEARVAKLQQVVGVLRRRAEGPLRAGYQPTGLRRTVEDFERELTDARRRLRQLTVRTPSDGS